MANSLVDQYFAGRRKMTELWHLIALHLSDDRSAAVPEPLFREAARYLSAHPPEAANGGVATLPANLVGRVEADRKVIEEGRRLFRAVADIVDPIDQEATMAALQEAHDNPYPKSLGEVIDDLERELGR